jgi:hypothetical protein
MNAARWSIVAGLSALTACATLLGLEQQLPSTSDASNVGADGNVVDGPDAGPMMDAGDAGLKGCALLTQLLGDTTAQCRDHTVSQNGCESGNEELEQDSDEHSRVEDGGLVISVNLNGDAGTVGTFRRCLLPRVSRIAIQFEYSSKGAGDFYPLYVTKALDSGVPEEHSIQLSADNSLNVAMSLQSSAATIGGDTRRVMLTEKLSSTNVVLVAIANELVTATVWQPRNGPDATASASASAAAATVAPYKAGYGVVNAVVTAGKAMSATVKITHVAWVP